MAWKRQYLIVHDGEFVMKVVASTEEKAITAAQRKAAKCGLPKIDAHYARAIAETTNDIETAIGLACIETINFQPA